MNSEQEDDESYNTPGQSLPAEDAWGDLEKAGSNCSSEAWLHFKRYAKNHEKSKCDHCGVVITVKKGNTSHMKGHLLNAHKELMRLLLV